MFSIALSHIAKLATAAATNAQTSAFEVADSASTATDQQIFFPEGESLVIFALLIVGVFFGIALQLFLPYLMTNNKRFTAALVMLGYLAVVGFVTVSFGASAMFWIGFATAGGYFLAYRVNSRRPSIKR